MRVKMAIDGESVMKRQFNTRQSTMLDANNGTTWLISTVITRESTSFTITMVHSFENVYT